MKKFEKFIYKDKEYFFIGTLTLDSKQIFVLRNLEKQERAYFIKNSQEEYEQILDRTFINKINDYVSPKSLDVVYSNLDSN